MSEIPNKSTGKSVTLKEKFEQYFTEKLQSGEKLTNKSEFVTLKKRAMAELNMPDGNRAVCNDALKTVMDKLSVKIPDDVLKSKFNKLNVSLKRDEVEETPTAAKNPTNQNPENISQPKNLSKTDSENQPVEKPQVSQEYANSITMGLKHGFRTLMNFYAKTGMIEGAEEEKPKPQTIESYITETDELAKSWGDYCYRNNVNIGKYFELAILFVTTIVILGSPLINAIFFGKKKKKDEKKIELPRDEVKSEVKN